MGDEFDDDDIYSGLKQVTAKLYTTNTPGTKSKSNFDAGNNDHQQQQQPDSIQNPTKDTSQTITTGQPAQHTEEYVATICRAWKLGKCDRGDGCRYNHDQAYHNTEKWQPPNAKAKIFIGGIPFGLANLLPVLFNVKLKNYFFGTFLGILPAVFVFASLGSGLEKIIGQNEEVANFINMLQSSEIYIPIIGFVFIILFSYLLKKKFNNIN